MMPAAAIRQKVRQLHGEGLTDRQIAERLGEDRRRVCQFRRRLRLANNAPPRGPAPFARHVLRKYYGHLTAGQIAAELGLDAPTVARWAKALGLSHRVPRLTNRPGLVKRYRRLHAAGYSDPDAAQALGVERHALSRLRQNLGLASNKKHARQRQKTAAKTREQLAAIGLKTLGQLRPWSHRRYARRRGWPDDLRKRQVEILEFLWTHGPSTRIEIAENLGLHRHRKSGTADGWWYPMMCNVLKGDRLAASTSYLADLMARGLVISLGRCVRNPRPDGKAQGRNTMLYSLPITIHRRFDAAEENGHATQTATG